MVFLILEYFGCFGYFSIFSCCLLNENRNIYLGDIGSYKIMGDLENV